MRRLRDLSLKHKLVGLIMAVLSGALLIGFVIEMFTDISSYKEELRRSAMVTARLTAINSAAALAFDDRTGAQETLNTLEAVPYIDAAYLYDSALNIFASYAKKDLQSEIARDLLREGSESRLVNGFLHVVQAVSRNGRLYGFVYTMASTRELDARINSTLISVAVLVGCLLVVSYLVAVRLQRIISNPIHNLADVAQQISRDGDYSQRAVKWGADEIGALYDSFNEMLDQIEARKLERDRAEDALRVSEEKYRTYISNAPNGVLVLDNEGYLIEVNRAMCDYTGYDSTELCRKTLPDLFSPRGSGKGDEFVCELQATGRSSGEMLISRRNGGDQCFTISGVRLSHDRLILFASDVTDLKRAQEELESLADRLEQSNRELSDFATVASHDLQEPLRKVRAFGDRLKQTCNESLSDQGRDYLERMQHAADRMQVLINDLLTYSRITTKAQPHAPVDLSKIVREVMEDLEVRIEEVGGRVEIGELPTVLAEPLQMRQLMQNLIGNALKFHKPDVPPVITIYPTDINGSETDGFTFAESQPTFCSITIADNGIGFDEKYADRIFGVFQRLHGRDEYEGTGVGLAVCRKIVDRHLGSIVAHAKEGEGATFIITLPVAEPKGESSHEHQIETDYHPAG